MAAPVQPEQSGQPGQTGRVIPRGSSSSPTPPTSPQPGQSTEGGAPIQPGASVTPPTAPAGPTPEQRLLAAQEAVLREQAQELARLRQENRAFDGRIKNIESPAPSKEEENQRFWKDPVGVINDLIQGELKRTVEPINEYISGQRTETAYDRMKGKLKEEYGELWPQIEGEVDKFVQAAAQAGNTVNDQLLSVAALAATGAYHRGLLGPVLPSPSPAPAPTPPPAAPAARADMATPPHLRPSAPAVPGHERPTSPPLRDLTENEARLARERGMTKEAFLSWIDVPADQVVHSKIGRPAS